jgi:hypothetical protein
MVKNSSTFPLIGKKPKRKEKEYIISIFILKDISLDGFGLRILPGLEIQIFGILNHQDQLQDYWHII